MRSVDGPDNVHCTDGHTPWLLTGLAGPAACVRLGGTETLQVTS
ncbi:hypothetical protein [Streptomyces sp. BHT-5-2]|nr:hypothetical protein [Streptomyces sp. BHT-5-2]